MNNSDTTKLIEGNHYLLKRNENDKGMIALYCKSIYEGDPQDDGFGFSFFAEEDSLFLPLHDIPNLKMKIYHIKMEIYPIAIKIA